MVDKPYTEQVIVVDDLDPTKFVKLIVEDGKAKLIAKDVTLDFDGGSAFDDAVSFNTGINSTSVISDIYQHGTDVVFDQVDVAVSSAEILALNATPKTLVAAPGANKALVLLNAIFFLDFNSAAYDGIAAGEDLVIRYTDGSGGILGIIETSVFLNQVTDTHRYMYPSNGTVARTEHTLVANAPLVLHMTTGEVASGDSPIGVRLQYATIDLSTLAAS